MNGSKSIRIHEVQPGFNSAGIYKDPIQALTAKASMDIFDEQTRKLLESGEEFKLKLGEGFENADISAGLVSGPCKGLASIEQLSFLKERGMTGIIMNRLHPTLSENAKSIGLNIEILNQ